jgi:RNA polymerase sigma factor (sigma-70 family)
MRSDSSALESTRTLLFRIREGDGEAREALLGRFLPSLRRWAHGRLPQGVRDLTETDDLVQVAFLRALPHFERFDPRRPGAFLCYLHQIVINLIREEMRRASRRPGHDPLPEELPEDRPEFLERTLGRNSIEAYEEALAGLTEEQQQAVVLRLEFGFSHQEIAHLLGRASANAVRMQVARGLIRLAEKMDAYR